MNTYVISTEDKRDIIAMLERYQPWSAAEVEQKQILLRKLDDAVIVPASRISRTIVTAYSIVRIVDLRQRDESTYTLVFPTDADVSGRRVSILSPLGTAMLGCDVGAIVEIKLPTATIPFAIREVLYQPDWNRVEVPL